MLDPSGKSDRVPPRPAYEPPESARPASAAPSQSEILAAEAAHDPYSALKLRDFRLYVIAGMAGVIGSQIQVIALQWELYDRTQSKALLGYLGLIQFLPMLIFGIFTGQLADIYNRKRIVVLSQVVSVFAALALYFLSSREGPIWAMMLCVFVRTTASTFGRPARQALLPQIVPMGKVFSNAITWNSSIFQLALVIGPAMGGYVLRYWVPLAYLLDSACSVFSFITIAMVRPTITPPQKEPASLQSLLAGFRFVWKTKIILATLTLDLFGVLLGGATALIPVFAKDVLNVGAEGAGWLRAAPAIGAVAMALLLTHAPPMKRAGKTLLWAVAGFGAATIVFGYSTSFWLSMSMLAVTGALDNVSVVVRHSLVQMLAPDAMRGRISAVNSMFIDASNKLGELESGLTAEWFGAAMSVMSGGVGTIGIVILCAAIWPEIRRIGALNDIKPEGEGKK